jgi:hypothetical protein
MQDVDALTIKSAAETREKIKAAFSGLKIRASLKPEPPTTALRARAEETKP